MKKKKLAIVCLCAVLLAGGLVLFLNRSPEMPVTVIETGHHPANNKQYSSFVDLGVYNHNLYAFVFWDEALYVLRSDGFDRQATVEGFSYGIGNSGFYYSAETDSGDSMVFHMDPSTGESIYLCPKKPLDMRDVYYSEDSVFYYPADKEKNAYYPIVGKNIGDPVDACESFQLNGRTYMLQDGFNDNHVVYYDQSGQVHSLEEDIPWGFKSLIPCDQGLLVHNEEQGDLLYLIEKESGEVIELFTVECMTSISAVNVHGDYAYLSFKRYEKHGEIGMLSYENDTLEGTYRISLTDYSVEKISDDIYNGLFIFDDTGIYATNKDDEIYKLDFDGNIIEEIEKPSVFRVPYYKD